MDGLRISGRWVREFRRFLPTLPLGWSPEPRLDMDWAYLRSQGVCYMPQAYPVEIQSPAPGFWTVEHCLDVARGYGYRNEECNPLVQLHGDPDIDTVRQYVTDARTAGLRWLTLYPLDQALARPDLVDACLDVVR